MHITTRKSNYPPVLALLSALVIVFTLLNLRPAHDYDSLRLSAGNIFGAEEREEMEKEGKAEGAMWFMSQRTYGLGYIPQDAEIRAVEDMRHRMIPALAAKGFRLQKSAAGQLNWQYHGPGNIGGRLRGLVVNPNNPNIIYVGSVSGGVWKSTDRGASWFPTMNDLITLNVSALAMKPNDPNTLYAGTGEGFMYVDNFSGRGILKTSDGGNTWKRADIAQGLNSPFINALAVTPANPAVVYAAGRKTYPTVGWPAETVPAAGINAIYKSTDSGETWQDVTTGKGIENDPSHSFDDIPTDVAVSPTDANVVYAAFGLYHWGGIWKSTNGGQTWSRLTNGLPDPSLPNMGYGRIKLAMAPSNPNILYASFSYEFKNGDTATLEDNAMLGIWKTTNAGQSWTQMTTPLTINQRNRNDGLTTALGSQAGYAHALIVHPTDPNIVFIGGLDIYKTTDGGNSWSQVSMWIAPGDVENPENLPYAHADHHVFAFDLSTDPPTLYNGSDGGAARSRDLGQTWEELNHDLGVTQFYAFAVHPTNPDIMLGGTQDNGTPMLRSGQINSWNATLFGDGWQTFFDYTDPTRFYASRQEVSIGRLVMDYTTGNFIEAKEIGYTNGANGITQRDADKAAFYAPYELSPNNPNVLILGTNRLLKSTNRGDSWAALSTEIDTALTSVAIADGNDNIMWFATMERLYKTEDNGATYANVTGANFPKRFLTDIEFDPSNNRNVYVTYSGYGTPHVFKSTNAGASWTDISSNLPDVPANTIQVHPQKPNELFLGTDIGVFLSEDGGQTWQPCTNNFPTTQVTAIVLNTNLNRVYAATHGRGAYSAELPSNAAILQVEANEIQIQAKPGQTGAASFAIANAGGADLSFNITTSSGLVNSSVASAYGGRSNLQRVNVPLRKLLPAPSKSKSLRRNLSQHERHTGAEKDAYKMTENAGKLHATPVFSLAQPAGLQGNDLLILDDGNNTQDDFIGEGPNSVNEFYWMNQFDLTQDFQLEAVQFYMRTETQTSNSVEVAIMDDNFDDLLRANVNMTLAPTGGWFTINFTNPRSFKTGDTFYLELGANAAITYPAGADKNAQTPNRSYHYNWDIDDYEEIGAVAGFQNGAYLIRALGTKSGGDANQLPVAKAQLSKSQAEVNEPITFDASPSYDPDGQITQYLWNFGDNTTSDQKIATHAYARAGNYLAKLTVTDDKGATGQTLGLVTISSGGANRLAVDPVSGTIAPGGSQTIKVTFDAQGLAEGNYEGQLNITSNGGGRTVPVSILVSSTTGVEDEVAGLPRAFRLEQNYPNPFNPETSIRYELPNEGNVALAVFDLNGRRLALLESGLKTAGRHFVRWDGRDSAGNRVPSGVYFYRLEARTPNGVLTSLTKKLAVLK